MRRFLIACLMLAAMPGSLPAYAQTLPHRDGTEGFFIARLRREDAA